MPDEFSMWDTSSGMLDGYDSISVKEAVFGYDAESQTPEKLFLFLDILTTDPENGEGGVVRERYTMGGEHWNTPDRGATAIHNSGKPTKFNNNSGIGLLTDSLVAAIGRDAAIALGNPLEADTWRKLGAFKWQRKEFSMTADNGETVNYSRMLIVEAINGGSAPAASSTPAAGGADASAAIDAAAAASVASASPGADTSNTYTCPPTLKVKLKKVAKETASHDEFAEQAFAMEGVADVAEMEEKVADEGFYLWLKNL